MKIKYDVDLFLNCVFISIIVTIVAIWIVGLVTVIGWCY